jgi:ABC-type transport system involved in cytochrome c biogenesis permease subunit
MPSEPLAPLAAGALFLLAAVAQAKGWRAGTWLAAAGASVLTGAMVARGLQAGHWPLTNEYEFALAFALGTSLSALALDRKPAQRAPGAQAVALVLATTLVAYARLVMPASERAIQPLLPALDSAWLPLHVATAALAYGALAVAGAAGLLWLLEARQRDQSAQLWQRAIAAGYPLLTLSMVFGLIWAQVAWGLYWSWDPKEIWTLIIWLVYTLYWHLVRRPGWAGRRMAWLSLAGLGAVSFTFLGVGWLARSVGLESLHLF